MAKRVMTLKQSVLAIKIISADLFRKETRCIAFEFKTEELKAREGSQTESILSNITMLSQYPEKNERD